MTCPATSAFGSPCTLPAGHDGDHQRVMPNTGFVFRWSDEGQQKFIDGQRGRLGT